MKGRPKSSWNYPTALATGCV